MSATQNAEADESVKERIDREYRELLDEIRVALPGVEVLFAFLLTVPFSHQFAQLDRTQQVSYFVALLLVALACGLLLAPTAYHRLRFREGFKPWITRRGNTFVVIAMLALAAGVSTTLFVVTSLMFSRPVSITVALASGAFLYALWFGPPLLRRDRAPGACAAREVAP